MKAKKKSKQKKSVVPETCFTIMPFGSWFDSYYDEIYVPAIESAGLRARRADDLYRPSAIVNDIWDLTKKAKVVLADLTGKNPNVFYELGLAHALAKPVIMVTSSIDDVPFDLRSLRVIVYDKNQPNWGDDLGRSIEKSIKEVLESPLAAVLPTFLSVRDEKKPSVTESELGLIQVRQEIEVLRRMIVDRDSLAHQEPFILADRDRDVARRRYLPPYMIDERIQRLLATGLSPNMVERRLFGSAPSSFISKRVRHFVSQGMLKSESPSPVSEPGTKSQSAQGTGL